MSQIILQGVDQMKGEYFNEAEVLDALGGLRQKYRQGRKNI